MIKRFILVAALSVCTLSLHARKVAPLLIIDTSQGEPYNFSNPFGSIAQSVGWHVDYHPISSVIDAQDNAFQPNNYKGVFFLIDIPFLQKLTSSPISGKVIRIMQSFAKSNKRLIGIFLSPKIPVRSGVLTKLAPLFKAAGLDVAQLLTKKNGSDIAKIVDSYFSIPFEKRSFAFHRTLALPARGLSVRDYVKKSFDQATIKRLLTPDKMHSFMPISSVIDKQIHMIPPLGVYLFNAKNNNHYFLASISILNFSGISENFHLCPTDFTIRHKLHEAVAQTMWELKQAAENIHGLPVEELNKNKKPALTKEVAHIGRQKKQAHSFEQKLPRKTAWMEISAFDNESKKKQQDDLMTFIFEAKLDSLWISMAPNMYYSPLGKMKEQKKNFLATIGRFTKRLQQEASERSIATPHIIIGFEVSNNYEGKQYPSPARGLYGTVYPRCPQPLDYHFWNNEMVEPLKQFATDWQQPKISNGVSLSGVILDLEMYFARPGMYDTLMGFAPTQIHSFASLENTNQFASYLVAHKKCRDYFAFIEKKAEKLGNYIKSTIHEVIPQATIGCYVPSLTMNWFYKGLYRGLSSTRDPLLLLSFNTEFNSHKKWLLAQNIQAAHSGVLMLSKLQKTEDINRWIDYFSDHHYGVWINRFSRLVEKYLPNMWSTIEQTPLKFSEKERFARYLARKFNLPSKTTVSLP